MKRGAIWAWLWIVLGAIYFFLPLYATFDFSLRLKRGVLSFAAYENVFNDARFIESFTFSLQMALWTILVSLILIVPTAYWVHLRLPKIRPIVELITLMPFVVPAVVLTFGFIQVYSKSTMLFGVALPSILSLDLFTLPVLIQLRDFVSSRTPILLAFPIILIAGYTVLSFPYMYRAVDTGLRAMDVRTLTEAAESLGASTPKILWYVIFPNLRAALLSGAFLTIAIVVGEFTLASLLVWPAFGPYIQLIGANRAYEPAALSVISFGLTWATLGLLQLFTRGQQGQIAGAR
ncbi:MAG: ABC transporter permease subunit [Chloroflexi bacterium]|nr:ABC transporter permease subunit [Chloroflexota bacterium]MBI5052730.1 ABC transporter permease subunit [Chloroflexota bacterium]MBI5348941.1 ABC transporter permease subunit [Chloroflexota bacterium]MBI5714894.1 ABC transporter permease subunit [Chloroflexota bacterium]